jgi:hypothetical protein
VPIQRRKAKGPTSPSPTAIDPAAGHARPYTIEVSKTPRVASVIDPRINYGIEICTELSANVPYKATI